MNDQIVDVLVVGSGAGALTAAVTAANHGAKVLVVEKSKLFGGTSAMSGGGVWVPNNSNAKKLGQNDSFEEALLYMTSMIGDQVKLSRLETYVKRAPEMLDYLQTHTHLKMEAYPYPDYYSDAPGAKEGYRTQAPRVFRGSKLGDDLYKMQPQAPGSLVQGKFSLTFKEARKFLTQDKGWRATLFKMLFSYYADIPGRMKGKLSRRLTQGHSLVGSLFLSVKEQGVDVWLDSPMKSLLHENGVVTGAMVERGGEEIEVHASNVILAAGGFEHNENLRHSTLPKPTHQDWSVSQDANTGDAIVAAGELNAATDLMNHAWWIPVVKLPGWPRAIGIFAERSLPRLVIVNKHGKRIGNEADPYLESGYAMYRADSIPSWLIFDSRFRKKYPFGPLGPGWATPDKFTNKKVKAIWAREDTLEDLAATLKIDAYGLRHTIERNNIFAETGVDEDFQRGSSFYDRYYGDHHNKPNPCIAPISEPPFYALPLHPGDIGTKGGLLTNDNAQVLNTSGEVIEGLYACGNTSAAVMGDKYLGAGATLGPAMTFGYLAALHATQHERRAS